MSAYGHFDLDKGTCTAGVIRHRSLIQLVVLIGVFLAAVLWLVGTPVTALATSYTWNGGNGYWGDASHWTPNGVPTAEDTADISAGGTYTVFGSGTVVAKTLSLGGGSGQQTLSIEASAATDSGGWIWQNSALIIGGGSVIEERGVLRLAGSPSSRYGSVGLSVDKGMNPGVLTNQGLIEYARGGGCSDWQVWGDVVNEGDFVAAAVVTHWSGLFTNRGEFTVPVGDSFLANGTTNRFLNESGDIYNHGTFYYGHGVGFEQGAGVVHDQPIVLQGQLTLSGAGVAQFQAVGSVSVSGTLAASQSITLMSGTAYSTNAGAEFDAPFTAYGRIAMTSGGASGGGICSISVHAAAPGDALRIGNGGSLVVDDVGGGTRSLWGNLTNEGTVTVDANFSHSGGGLFDNHSLMTVTSGHTFDSNGNSLAFKNGTGGRIDNQGVFYFSGGVGFTQGDGTTSGTPVIVDSVPLAFTGVGASSFTLVGSVGLSGATGSAQTITAKSGTSYNTNATAWTIAPFTNGGTITLASGGGGGGGQSAFGGNLAIIPINNNVITCDYSGGGTRLLNCILDNHGTIAVSSVGTQTGILQAYGLTSDPSGILAVRIGGLVAGTDYDVLTSAYSLSLGGKLRVTLIRGFVPDIGSSFDIVSSAGLTGTFATTDLPSLGPGKIWRVSYEPTAVPTVVRLSVVAGSLETPTLTGSSGTKTTAYNGAVTIYADLKAGVTPLSGMPVYLEYSANGSSGWTRATAVITQPIAGRYQTIVKRTIKGYYRFRFAGDGTYGPSIGPAVKVYPKAYLTNPYAPTTVYRNRAFTTYGYLKPRHTSGSYPVRIYKYRYVSGVWKSYGYVTAKASNYSSYTKYLKALSLPYAGKWRLRTYAPADSGHAATWSSGYDNVTVK